MSQTSKQGTTSIRSEAKVYYRDKQNVTRKWLDQYGNVSLDGDYQRNRSCVSEVFNMLDIVMENCIDDFRRTHVIHSISYNRGTPRYAFAGDDGSKVVFDKPTTFAKRTAALRAIGYDIPDELAFDTRILRNETTHGNQTVILKHMELGYDETMTALRSIADTLILLDMLDPIFRTPDFEMLRVQEGDTLQNGAYTIGPMIGEGGMSRVYEASQMRLGRLLAIKELKPGSYSDELIRHECETLMRLHHPQIPQIHDTFYENSTYYIVMSYVEGVTLEEYIAKNRLSNEDRRSITKGLCKVLSYLHSDEVGIVFADLSPDNIIIDPEQTPHLIDFGISGKKDTKQAVPAATMDYAAPEVLSGRELDERSDIYALGYVLRYLYTGLSPAEERETPTGWLVSDPVAVEIINRCTARNPEDRFESIDALSHQFFPELFLSDEADSHEKKRRFRRAVTAAVLCLAIGAAALAVWKVSAQKEIIPAETETSEEKEAAEETAEIMWEDLGIEDYEIEIWADDALEKSVREYAADALENEEIKTGPVMRSQLFEAFKKKQYKLDLSGKGIEDISVLCGWTELKQLNLSNNSFSDISALSGMADLTVLIMQNVTVGDLSPLAGLPLERLYLGDLSSDAGTRLGDLTVIGTISSLKELYLRNRGLSSQDIQWLKGLTGLEVLDISYNDVHDISMLSGLSALHDLNLEKNAVEDFSPLSGLNKLTTLDLSDTDISDISFLKGLPGLLKLALSNDLIADHSPVAALTELTYLDLTNTGLTDKDLPWIKNLTKLEYLFIKEGNPGISDFSSLDGVQYTKTDFK